MTGRGRFWLRWLISAPQPDLCYGLQPRRRRAPLRWV